MNADLNRHAGANIRKNAFMLCVFLDETRRFNYQHINIFFLTHSSGYHSILFLHFQVYLLNHCGIYYLKVVHLVNDRRKQGMNSGLRYESDKPL